MTDDPASTNWHLDRRVPIALILAIAIQSATAIWWASSVTAYMTSSARDQLTLSLRVDKLEIGRDDVSSRLVRVETQLGNISDQSKNQETLLIQILQEIRNKTPNP